MSNTDKLREMNSTDALREIAKKWELTQADLEIWKAEGRIVQAPIPEFLSDLTALISEHYTANEEVDKMVEERLRDELIDFLSYCKASNVATFGKYIIDKYLKSRDSHE